MIRTKFLDFNYNKEMKQLYSEKYKALLKISKQKDIPFLLTSEL